MAKGRPKTPTLWMVDDRQVVEADHFDLVEGSLVFYDSAKRAVRAYAEGTWKIVESARLVDPGPATPPSTPTLD